MPVFAKIGHLFKPELRDPRRFDRRSRCELVKFVAFFARVFALKTGVLIFLNGKFVPEERAVVSVFDRGFLYGDGVFETIPFVNGNPFRWEQHMERFSHGLRFLGLSCPYNSTELRQFAAELLKQNQQTDYIV